MTKTFRGFRVGRDKAEPPFTWAENDYGEGTLLVWCPYTRNDGRYVSLNKCTSCPYTDKECELRRHFDEL